LLKFSGALAKPETDKQSIMLLLESVVKDQVEPRLELYLEPVQDQSKLRRLKLDSN